MPQDVASFEAHLRKQGFQGLSLTSADAQYATYDQRFTSRTEMHPPRIVVPENADDVSRIVRAGIASNVEVVVQCGGCNASDETNTKEGVLMHLGKLNSVAIDEKQRVAHVGGGCRWGQIYSALNSTNLEAVGASLGVVGVGGFLTMGGYSCWSGQHGMGCDNVVAVDIVTGTGEEIHANLKENADLLWGVRGGLTNLGVVTKFTIQLHEKTAETHFGYFAFPGTHASELLKVTEDFVKKQNRQQVCIVTFARPVMVGQPCLLYTFYVYGSRKLFDEVIAPFMAVCQPLMSNAPPSATQHEFSEMGAVVFNPPGKPRRHSNQLRVLNAYTRELGEAFWDAFLRLTDDKRFQWGYVTFELHDLTVLSENPNQISNAWAHRYKHIYSLIDMIYAEEADDDDADKMCQAVADELEVGHKKYIGRPTSTWPLWATCKAPLEESYSSSYATLKKLKQRYDPNNVFARSCSVAGPKTASRK